MNKLSLIPISKLEFFTNLIMLEIRSREWTAFLKPMLSRSQ